MKTFKIELEGELFTVAISKAEYVITMNDAYILIEIEESGELGQPFATMTVNLEKVNKGCCFINNSTLCNFEKFVEYNNLGVKTGYKAESGYCTYNLYRMCDELANLKVGEFL